LPIQQLAHRDGCHVWLWSPWPAIRKGAVHGIIDSWQLRRVAELQWDRGSKGRGRWYQKHTEVLILASRRNLPLLKHDLDPQHAVEQARGGAKPDVFRKLIEAVSPGPRIELFAKEKHDGWDRWPGTAPGGDPGSPPEVPAPGSPAAPRAGDRA
jgi:N6-adenosine-specific RNA methylase IME4